VFNFARLQDRESIVVKARILTGATYLHDGEIYLATREGQTIHFRRTSTGSGTSESLSMLRALSRNNAATFSVVEAN
jgi:hypothetical protein